MYATGWSGAQTADQLGVTEAWVSKLRHGRGNFSDTMTLRIQELERLHLSQNSETPDDSAVEEEQAPYGERRQGLILPASHCLAEPLPEPTDAELLRYFQRILDAAAKVPGGRGFVALQLRLHLNPDLLARFDGK